MKWKNNSQPTLCYYEAEHQLTIANSGLARMSFSWSGLSSHPHVQLWRRVLARIVRGHFFVWRSKSSDSRGVCLRRFCMSSTGENDKIQAHHLTLLAAAWLLSYLIAVSELPFVKRDYEKNIFASQEIEKYERCSFSLFLYFRFFLFGWQNFSWSGWSSHDGVNLSFDHGFCWSIFLCGDRNPVQASPTTAPANFCECCKSEARTKMNEVSQGTEKSSKWARLARMSFSWSGLNLQPHVQWRC